MSLYGDIEVSGLVGDMLDAHQQVDNASLYATTACTALGYLIEVNQTIKDKSYSYGMVKVVDPGETCFLKSQFNAPMPTKAGLESLTENIKKGYAAVIAWIKKMISKLKVFVTKFFDVLSLRKSTLKRLSQKIKASSFDNQVVGKADMTQIRQGYLDDLLKFLNATTQAKTNDQIIKLSHEFENYFDNDGTTLTGLKKVYQEPESGTFASLGYTVPWVDHACKTMITIIEQSLDLKVMIRHIEKIEHDMISNLEKNESTTSNSQKINEAKEWIEATKTYFSVIRMTAMTTASRVVSLSKFILNHSR